MRDGSWCGFKYFRFDGTESRITISARGNASGTIKIYSDLLSAPVGFVPVRPCEVWIDHEGDMKLSSCTASLYFVYEGSGSLDIAEFTIR